MNTEKIEKEPIFSKLQTSILAMEFNNGLLRAIFLVLPLLASVANGEFNVKKYGAVGDGKHDCTQAFQQAWNETCNAEGGSRLLVPGGNFLVGPLLFKGPCKGPVRVRFDGNVLAHTDLSLYNSNWISFQYIDGLRVTGHGKVDGQGALAWPHNQCPKKWECKTLPISMSFSFVTNATVRGISSINSKFFHMNFFNCKNIDIRSIKIEAPGDSPNTDGIHIALTSNISIAHSTIGTGDDCVSIGEQTRNITIKNVFCGPGHGISVGSLGKNNVYVGDVVGLTVKNCTLTGTTNGVRIKTWGAKPMAEPINMKCDDFVFENIVMNNVSNPIIIDQKYCPYAACLESLPSRIRIRNVAFRHIRGTSFSPEAIKLVCSAAMPCQYVELKNINLEYIGNVPAANVTSSCVSIDGISVSNVNPTLHACM